MKMLIDLISTDYGLMSLIVIVILIAMWIYFTVLFMGKINKSGTDASKKPQAPVTKN
ncbi:DUF3149 domain-containing protein [Comamonas sp. NoAH]|uniref:DUF3149 domain-containing protein n=1 Tax=Comamonas halotolerans TaxID=3041496 RepID=UPI0024E12DD0|nr:DUF3149 domain-containing protein [Comamonas sp. NoAH]